MSKEHKNPYEQKAKQRALHGFFPKYQPSEAKKDFKKTMIYTGKDVLIGAIGGGLAGALAGRSSLLLGLVITGAGHYFGSPSASMFGVGMMASGGYQTVTSAMNGPEKSTIEGVKDRFSNFQKNLKYQLFLDKIPSFKKNKSNDDGTNGMGDVQYFKYPNGNESDLNGKNALDLREIERIEAQINQSARNFAQKNRMTGSVSGIEDMDGIEGVEERLI